MVAAGSTCLAGEFTVGRPRLVEALSTGVQLNVGRPAVGPVDSMAMKVPRRQAQTVEMS